MTVLSWLWVGQPPKERIHVSCHFSHFPQTKLLPSGFDLLMFDLLMTCKFSFCRTSRAWSPVVFCFHGWYLPGSFWKHPSEIEQLGDAWPKLQRKLLWTFGDFIVRCISNKLTATWFSEQFLFGFLRWNSLALFWMFFSESAGFRISWSPSRSWSVSVSGLSGSSSSLVHSSSVSTLRSGFCISWSRACSCSASVSRQLALRIWGLKDQKVCAAAWKAVNAPWPCTGCKMANPNNVRKWAHQWQPSMRVLSEIRH